MPATFTATGLLNSALARFEAAMRAGVVGGWPETGLPDELQQAVADDVVADVRARAEVLLRAALARNATVFDPTTPGKLAGQGELISDVVQQLFAMRLSMSIAVHRMILAEQELAEAREPGPTPTPPPPPGLRDIVPLR